MDTIDPEVVLTLQRIFAILTKGYDSDLDKTGIRHHKNGSFEVIIDKGPTYWFNNSEEFSQWALGVLNAN